MTALRSAAIAAAAFATIAAGFSGAQAQSASPDCERLRQAISDASRNPQTQQFQAAAERQRGEIDRTVSYMRSIGCDNRKFLFFGSEPPPQCGTLTQQVQRMRANLDDLQSRAGGGAGGRGELIARYNSQCSGGRPGGALDTVFGDPNKDMTEQPLNPDGSLDLPANPGEARAGSKAVCVRTCDGSFFPVSYSAGGGRLDGLEDMCRALCPNADVTLFTYPASGEIEQAVSATGQRYVDSPNALKYRQTYDPSCSCRKRGQTWVDALSNAESKLGHENRSDIIVTPEKAAELSRPKLDVKADPKTVDAKGKPIKGKPTPTATPAANAGGTDVNGVDTTLSQQAATVSRETTGIAAPTDAQNKATVGQDQGQSVEVTGPDGVKRRVRVIGPTL